MKLGKLKKRSIKELETLRDQIYKFQNSMNKRFDKMVEVLDTSIHHVDSIKLKKNKKNKLPKDIIDLTDGRTVKINADFKKQKKGK